jgi:hypothetical protein
MHNAAFGSADSLSKKPPGGPQPSWILPRRFGLAFAAHIPDERLAALVHMHVLNADNLRATAPQTA